jgi:hypothetical protein
MTPEQLQETSSLLDSIRQKQEAGADCDAVAGDLFRLAQLGAVTADPEQHEASVPWIDPEWCQINSALALPLQADVHTVFGVWGLRSMTDSRLWLAMRSLSTAATMFRTSQPLCAVVSIARFLRSCSFASATSFTHIFEHFGQSLVDWGSETALQHPQTPEAEEFHLSLVEVLLPASLQQFDEESMKYEEHAIDLVTRHLLALLSKPPTRQKAAPWAAVARIMEMADQGIWGGVAIQLLEALQAGDTVALQEIALKKAALLEDGSSFIVGEERLEQRKEDAISRYNKSLEDIAIGRLLDASDWAAVLKIALVRADRIEREAAEGKREMQRPTTCFDREQCENWTTLALCYSELKRDTDFRTLFAKIMETLRTADAGDILGMPEMGSSVTDLVNALGALATQRDLTDCLDSINAFTDDYAELGWDDDT